jgi:acyl-[acyl carrier protein]--UDP-N-acetylglucosamine O-acyltransferase
VVIKAGEHQAFIAACPIAYSSQIGAHCVFTPCMVTMSPL